ncbi:nitrous oxide reductase accessory protein NosL [Daejeonella lutea]|uniref:Copper chaperone NosL n=1 Tax=Daejeonella lutea TaxID=572036 RepID=A0A1T5A4Q0_9SPHI|nr:nitrous oxide reductase accessory protein NosL [Daejeonella lutea]SKB29981.1 copper chaperone NosL [Daejeonella lutea]
MNNKIENSTRLLLGLCGLCLIVVLFTPIWRIDLTAPQYPEGLFLTIHANKLAGNVDIINGLNHYIGMKTLHADDFIEFKVLPGIILFFSGLFILAAFLARRNFLNIAFRLFVAFGVLAMVDFWRWEFDYGHNLDPNAAIIVPGMAYQPPLIGFKQLLNFGAYSMPDIGGWIFVGVGAILLYLVIKEWKVSKEKPRLNQSKIISPIALLLILNSCSNAPVPIKLGKDNCHFCKMTISDERFGAEIVTKKSKVFKFDDPHCATSFLNSNTIRREEIAGIYFVNFNKPHDLIDAEKAHFLQSPSLRSPMNGNIASFSHKDSLEKAVLTHYGNITTWEDMQK